MIIEGGNKINTYIEKDDCYIMIVESPKYGIKEFVIDKDDYDKVKNIQWGICAVYAYTDKYENIYYANNNKMGLLHRYIMDAPKGMVVDHIYGDTFDTRKQSLRLCSHKDNCRNRKKQLNNTSGYQGVTWDKLNDKWMAYICVNKTQHTLGYFDDKEEAHKYRLQKVQENFGEFVRLNEQ